MLKADIVAVGGDYSIRIILKARPLSARVQIRFSFGSNPTPRLPLRRSLRPSTKTWITVGPNGTDISTDDGRNWRALKPSATDTPDADQHWNALSLPFVAGPHGRIGLLNSTALQPAKH